MEFRNPTHNVFGTIDCEINHPQYGWIPHTISADENPDLQARAVKANPIPYVAPPAPTQEQTLTLERLTMTCTPMQGILALGETQWNAILSYRDTQATWAEKVIVDGAQTWVRNSQNIAFFQYLLGLTDTQVDDLFRLAATLEA